MVVPFHAAREGDNRAGRGVLFPAFGGAGGEGGDNREQEEAEETLEVDYKGSALDIGFNVNYLLDVLNNVTGNDGTINYAGPGYTASLKFTVDSGAYTLNVTEDGLVAVMNDLHKGRDSDKSWKWVIDVSAVFLVLVSLSGLLIQLFQRKRRTRALIVAAAGLLVTVVFIWFAVQ